MKESKLDNIKNNNRVISSLIEKIINSNTEEGFIIDKNGNYDISDTYKEMIGMEIKKLLKIYHLEFPNLPYDDKRELDIRVYKGTHISAMYLDNSVQYSSAIKSGFEDLKKGILEGKPIQYTISEDGQVIYQKENTPNCLTEKMHTNLIDKNDGTPYILKSNETVENDLNDCTDFLYFYLNDSKYETKFFSALPHEVSHAFGFTGGIFEGLTETVARETAQKYGLTPYPFPRKDLTVMMQNIEKTIGRDKLVEYAHAPEGTIEKIDLISSLIDEKINPDKKDSFAHYYDIDTKIEIYHSDLEDMLFEKFEKGEISREDAFKTVNEDPTLNNYKKLHTEYGHYFESTLNDYVNNNPDLLFEVGETEIIGSDKDFDDVISFQLSEIESLNKILEKVLQKNLEQNDEFKISLQSMVNNDIQHTTHKNTDDLSKEKNEINIEQNK